METKIRFTYEQMQELLPDYVFNRLNEDDIIIYETALPDYPDLVQEVKDVRSVFAKVEEMDFKKILDGKTKNLSVKVMQKLEKQKKYQFRHSRVYRIYIPTIAIAAMMLIFFKFDNIKSYLFPENNISSSIEFTNFSQKETQNLMGNEINLQTVSEIDTIISNHTVGKDLELSNIIKDDKDLYSALDETYIEEIITKFTNQKELFKNVHFSASIQNNDDLKMLDEDEIQQLLEEIQNDDFNS